MILNGGSDFQNWFALALGIPFLIIGIILLVKRAEISDVMSETQSRFGAVGRRVARENKEWVYIVVGTGFVVFSSLLILGGLFVTFAPPGTPL